MENVDRERERKKRAIFDTMSPKHQQKILKKGRVRKLGSLSGAKISHGSQGARGGAQGDGVIP